MSLTAEFDFQLNIKRAKSIFFMHFSIDRQYNIASQMRKSLKFNMTSRIHSLTAKIRPVDPFLKDILRRGVQSYVNFRLSNELNCLSNGTMHTRPIITALKIIG